ncbi:hypothetical protein CKO09_10815 [Chromatium weissei]|nr:hypothetical protein [Chromatium weissei]
MTSVRRALAFSFIERYLLIMISLLSNILLARLLTPKEIGVYSVSLAVIGIAQVLRDFGIGNFLIQEKNLTEAHIRTAFGISLLIGSALFLIIYFAAPFAARFYGEEQMLKTLQISSLNFFTLPFCTISLALLRREMAFKQLLWVNLIAATFGFLVTIGFAYSGFGPNSMAIGAVATNIATGITAWLARTNRQLLLPNFSEWRVVLNFGGQNTLAGIITSISMDANDLIVGKFLGFQSVAILSRAQGLMNLFHRDVMGAVRGVALPAFSNTHRSGGDTELAHIQSLANLTAFSWSFYGIMSIYSFEFIRLLFGSQWDAAVALVPIFCLAGAISNLNSLIPAQLTATGNIKVITKAEIMLQPMRLVFITAAAILFQSATACAIAYLLSASVAMPIFFILKNKAIPNNMAQIKRHLTPSFYIALSTLSLPLVHVLAFGLDRKIPIDSIYFFGVLFLSAVIWFVSIKLFDHPLCREKIYLKIVDYFAK